MRIGKSVSASIPDARVACVQRGGSDVPTSPLSSLRDEIDGETLMPGEWFVAARASLPDRS